MEEISDQELTDHFRRLSQDKISMCCQDASIDHSQFPCCCFCCNTYTGSKVVISLNLILSIFAIINLILGLSMLNVSPGAIVYILLVACIIEITFDVMALYGVIKRKPGFMIPMIVCLNIRCIYDFIVVVMLLSNHEVGCRMLEASGFQTVCEDDSRSKHGFTVGYTLSFAFSMYIIYTVVNCAMVLRRLNRNELEAEVNPSKVGFV